MANEGFRERTAVVLFKYEDGGEVETGEVDLGRLAGRGGGVVEME